jgi:aspartate aminotransferase-like enzyme
VKRDGFVIYAGLGEAAKTTFRVCTLGAIEIEVLAGFVESLERALLEARRSAAAAAAPTTVAEPAAAKPRPDARDRVGAAARTQA